MISKVVSENHGFILVISRDLLTATFMYQEQHLKIFHEVIITTAWIEDVKQLSIDNSLIVPGQPNRRLPKSTRLLPYLNSCTPQFRHVFQTWKAR